MYVSDDVSIDPYSLHKFNPNYERQSTLNYFNGFNCRKEKEKKIFVSKHMQYVYIYLFMLYIYISTKA